MDNAPQGAPAAPQPTDPTLAYKVMAYIGPLVVVSYFLGKDNPSVKYHVKQGLVLFALEIIIKFVLSFMWTWFYFFFAFGWIIQLLWLALAVLSILGIVNAVQGKDKELPVVGGFAKLFPL